MSTTTTAATPVEDLPPAPRLYTGDHQHEPHPDVDAVVAHADVRMLDGIQWYRTTEYLCRWCRFRYNELTVGPCRFREAGRVRGGR